MNRYRIRKSYDDGFCIERIDSPRHTEVVEHFDSYAEAIGWLRQQQRQEGQP